MTGGESPVFVDTNVLIRFTIASAPLHIESYEALNRLWQLGTEIWISRQVLREYAAVLTRPQTYTVPLSAATVAAELRSFAAWFHVADENTAVTGKLLYLLENVLVGGKQVHDANIVATMQAYGIAQLLTLNAADFTRFSPFIQVLSLEDVLKQSENPEE